MLMKKLSLTLLLLALPCLGWGQLYIVTSTLDAIQEVPARPSMGTGSGWGTLDTSTNWFDFNVTFSGLTSPQTAAHFHAPGPPGVNAPVEIPLPLGSPVHFAGMLTDLEEAQLLEGLFYVNVHTTLFPGGEIRGQLLATAVPEPSSYGIFGGAVLIGLMAYRRRAAKTKLGM